MKRIINIICLFACALAYADNTVYLPNATVEAGGTVTVAVHLQSDSPACGYQFDLVLPEGVSMATDSEGSPLISLSDDENEDDVVFDCAEMSDGSVRFLCYSLTNTAFSTSDDAVALVTLKVEGHCQAGTKDVTISNTVMSSPDAHTTYVPNPSVSTLTVETPSVMLGDVNGDGVVDAADIILLIKCYLEGTTSSLNLFVSDVNNDKTIDAADIIVIIKKYLDNE